MPTRPRWNPMPSCSPPLEAERLPHHDRADSVRYDCAVDDQDVVHAARHTVGLARAPVLQRIAVLADAPQSCGDIGDDLLSSFVFYHFAGPRDERTKLAPTRR